MLILLAIHRASLPRSGLPDLPLLRAERDEAVEDLVAARHGADDVNLAVRRGDFDSIRDLCVEGPSDDLRGKSCISVCAQAAQLRTTHHLSDDIDAIELAQRLDLVNLNRKEHVRLALEHLLLQLQARLGVLAVVLGCVGGGLGGTASRTRCGSLVLLERNARRGGARGD